MRKGKYIVIAIVVSILLLVILAINSFIGNPISKSLAKKAAKRYMKEQYSGLDLEIKKTFYDFKFKSYGVTVQSKTSEDTCFTIHTDGFGNVEDDNYENMVANNFTTWLRLSKELDERANKLLCDEVNYDFDTVRIQFVENSKSNQDLLKLHRDMELDISNPPLPLEVYVSVYTQEVSYTKIAEIAKEVEEVLKNHSIPIESYSVRLIPLSDKPKKENEGVSWVNAIAVNNFPSELMSEKDLVKVMEDYELSNSLEK